ncbi:hypothetical protein GOV06_00595 [Candidatus Woesearchaeota archaeon]|nr:hypothetical protein [Candidatus Woesearchaeota archaeon]
MMEVVGGYNRTEERTVDLDSVKWEDAYQHQREILFLALENWPNATNGTAKTIDGVAKSCLSAEEKYHAVAGTVEGRKKMYSALMKAYRCVQEIDRKGLEYHLDGATESVEAGDEGTLKILSNFVNNFRGFLSLKEREELLQKASEAAADCDFVLMDDYMGRAGKIDPLENGEYDMIKDIYKSAKKKKANAETQELPAVQIEERREAS